MKICLIGKFPPIQGGVSTRAYVFAHSLAQQEHEVHVITNAKDVRPPFRMFMRDADWEKCEASYGEGSVTVHWTDRTGAAQFHIPMSPAYVTKLSSLAIEVCREHSIDVILGFYMEPYGIAAFITASATGTPYVLKTAGSDAGRLWHQSQFKPLYDHVFLNARRIIAGGSLRTSLLDLGVRRDAIWPDPSFTVPEDVFGPDGEPLDVADLISTVSSDETFAPLVLGKYDASLPYIGVYGKLGEKKGTFALLQAIREILDHGTPVGLLVLGQERLRSERKFRNAVLDLDLMHHVIQLPFIPNWRVPEFIRRCIAVCCIEQDFPIQAHAPITPREVLVNGGCLISSFEMLRKLPSPHRLISGYNCVAISNVFAVSTLARAIGDVLSAPEAARLIGERGRVYARKEQSSMPFPDRLASILAGAVENQRQPQPNNPGVSASAFREKGPSWKELAAAELSRGNAVAPDITASDDSLCGSLQQRYENGDSTAGIYLDLVKIEAALNLAQTHNDTDRNLVFAPSILRNQFGRKFFDQAEFGEMIPQQEQNFSLTPLNFDGNTLLADFYTRELPDSVPSISNALAISREEDGNLRVLVLSGLATHILSLSNGYHTVDAILHEVKKMNSGDPDLKDPAGIVVDLFENGLIRLNNQINGSD